jgi:hypothetical protein
LWRISFSLFSDNNELKGGRQGRSLRATRSVLFGTDSIINHQVQYSLDHQLPAALPAKRLLADFDYLEQ